MNPSLDTTSATEPKNTWSRRSGLAASALLAVLIASHLVINWLWRQANVVPYGMDRIFHQVTSLAYYDILRDGLTLRTFFEALTWSDYYPPLVHFTVSAFYSLFGVSMDVAALSNSLFLLMLLVSVYGIGKRFGGPWVGLLSAFVVSTFPMIFALSRYLYIDYALTALVALSMFLLLESEGFRNKGCGLLYGISLGLGMLVKWTSIAFTAAPLILMIARSEMIKDTWRVLRPSSWNGRRWLAAILMALAITAVWFVPNLAATRELPLGYGLAPISWLLWSTTLYYILSPSSRGANLVAALGTALVVAGAWYLTRIEFVNGFWINAYGKETGRFWGYIPYLKFLYREQLSPFYAIVVVVAVLGLAWQQWQQTRSLRQFLALSRQSWVLVLWAIVPYVIFSTQSSIVHSRYIMPLLPPLGIAIAVWLSRIRPRWLRGILIAAITIVAVVQLATLSFDAFSRFGGRVAVFARGVPIQLPASGRTDPAYWVVDDVLETIESHRETNPAVLGVLVNAQRVNSKQFIYMVYEEFRHIEIKELATPGWAEPSYPRLFETDYVVLRDPSPDYDRRPDTRATMERLLNSPDDTFHRAFDMVESYPLPNDTQVVLYERHFATAEQEDLAYYEALMEGLVQMAQPGDAVIVISPGQIYALARYGEGSLPIYPLPADDGALSEADKGILEELGNQYERLWVVLGSSGETDPSELLPKWLADGFYRATDSWYGPLQLMLYAAPAGDGETGEFHDVQAQWENGIELKGYGSADSTMSPGEIVRIDLRWQAADAVSDRYKVFLHLQDRGGYLLSQKDGEPLEGMQPTTTWQPGEVVEDRHGLSLPGDLPDGEYQLIVGLYHAETGERLGVCCPAGDSITLASVHVDGEQVHVTPAP